MNGSQDGFTLEEFRYMHMKEEALGGLKYMTKFSFGYTILLGSIWTYGFMNNVMGLKEGGESGIDVIFHVVGAEATYGGRKLGFNKGVKMGNNCGEI